MTPIGRPPLRTVPWSLADVAWALLQVFAIALALVLAASILNDLLPANNGIAGFVATLLLEGALLLSVVVFGLWKHRRSWDALGLVPSPLRSSLLAAAVFGGILGFSIVYSSIMVALGLDSLLPNGLPDEITQGLPQQLLGSFAAIVAAPFAEEVFFRGFLLPAFAAYWGFWPGAAASSLLFALSHASLGLLLPAFVSGLLLAWLYRRAGSLWPCVMAHGLQNTLALWAALMSA